MGLKERNQRRKKPQKPRIKLMDIKVLLQVGLVSRDGVDGVAGVDGILRRLKERNQRRKKPQKPRIKLVDIKALLITTETHYSSLRANEVKFFRDGRQR